MLLLMALLLLVGCEYPGIPHPQAAALPAPRANVLAPQPRPAQPVLATGGQQPSVLQGRVVMIQKDFKLEPENLTVKAGAITFALQNEGRYTHDFRVEGQGVDEKGPKVGSGRTLEWRITLQPGTYRISCPVSNHSDRGMTGTLTVVP